METMRCVDAARIGYDAAGITVVDPPQPAIVTKGFLKV